MSRIVRSVPFLVAGVIGLTTGCGSGGSNEKPNDELFHNFSLEEVGAIYSGYSAEAKKAPKKLADVAKYEGYSTGFNVLRNGDVIVFWGASVSDADSDKVLAYEKAAPDSGGFVLMADGKTIKKLTVDEFKSAPKAGGAK